MKKKAKGKVPYLLQEISVAAMFLVVAALFLFARDHAEVIDKLDLTATVYPAVLADLANNARASENVQKLAWNNTLATAAEQKAQDMFANDYFAHTSPSGITPWYWFVKNNYDFTYAGENLAADFSQTSDVQNAWLNSPEHKANIVDPHFTEIGIAAADGVLQGKSTTVVVEFFAAPAVDQQPLVPTENKSSTPAVQKQITNPVVEGASVETIVEDPTYIAVKNTIQSMTSAPVAPETPSQPTIQAPWYDMLLVNPTDAVRTIYLFMIGAILVSMLLLLRKEYQKHHFKHFAMGTALVGSMTILLFFFLR